MAVTMRDRRSPSSTITSSVSWYSVVVRSRASITLAAATRLVIGERNSCARSDEKRDNCSKAASSRSSMSSNAPASAWRSEGHGCWPMRVCSRWTSTAPIRALMARSGARPRLTSNQPASSVTSMAQPITLRTRSWNRSRISWRIARSAAAWTAHTTPGAVVTAPVVSR